MKHNMKQILISIFFAFAVSILCFYAFHETFPPMKASDISEHKFFVEQLEIPSKKIFLLGGSGAAQVNSIIIDESLRNKNKNFVFYNLAYNADTPKQRYQSIHETLELEPELILYAVTYYDLNGYVWENKKESLQPLPVIELNPLKLIDTDNDPFSKINPKETTLSFIRSSFSDSEFFPSKRDRFQLEQAPFSFFDEYQTKIDSDANLQKITSSFVANRVNQDPSITKEQINYLRDIVKLTQEKEIEFVVIILPQQEYFLDLVPERDEILFYNSLNEIKNEFNIVVYDLSRNYENLNIWQDHNHVAFNPASKIFSDDIYKIILSELN